jgi:hypothetical protein
MALASFEMALRNFNQKFAGACLLEFYSMDFFSLNQKFQPALKILVTVSERASVGGMRHHSTIIHCWSWEKKAYEIRKSH